MEASIGKRSAAEFIGTFTLVLGGCGAAVLAAPGPDGIGRLGVAFAFGLSVLAMAYAIGPFSGAHLNPAVTVGLTTAGRFPGRDVVPYVVAQVAGAVVASFAILLIAKGQAGFDVQASGFAANGYGAHSPGGFGLGSALLAEVILSFLFVLVVLGATARSAPIGFAGIAIGLALTLVHLVGIPITNTSVNPARSTGPALFVGGWALAQLWMFWVAPLAGGLLAGACYKALERVKRPAVVGEPGEVGAARPQRV